MTLESIGEAKNLILKYLHSTYQAVGDLHGWGLSKGKNISITNTCEAVLTFDQLDELQDTFLLKEKENIITFLTQSLLRALEADTVRIRDISYPALALDILGVSEHKEKAVKKLFTLANERGGWPENSTEQRSSLVPTYHALFSLYRLDETIDEKHYIWLSTLQKSNYLCAFDPDVLEPSVGASFLVLYLSAYSRVSNADWVQRLAKKSKEELPKMFDKMHCNDQSWISYDRHSTFTIYGYGHALSALNYLEENLFNLNIQKFITTVDQETFNMQFPSIPAILEFSIALRSIRLNFDPFRYFNITSERITQSVKAELDSQHSLLVESEEKLKLHHALIDEWEKDIIRQRHEIPKLVISELFSFLKAQSRNVLRAIVYYLILFLLLFVPLGFIVEKIKTGTFSWFDSYLIMFAIIPVLIEVIRWRRKSRGRL